MMVNEREDLAELIVAVSAICAEVTGYPGRYAADLARVHPTHRASAENLLHYLALRDHDVRDVQSRLGDLGLSSLGRSEGHVRASAEAVLRALRALAGEPAPARAGDWVTFAQGRDLLTANTDALLGPPPAGRATRIMVTLPAAAADDYSLVWTLVEQGMDCARVNCAHDDAATWSKMIRNVRAAATETGRSCLVAMDLAGPKLRTGPVEEPLRLHIGDDVVLTRDLSPAPPRAGGAARIGCTLPELFGHVRVGQRVWFDDGKIGAVVTATGADDLRLTVNVARRDGTKLRGGKGINLPDTQLPISALTAKDETDLPFVAAHADLVSLSFVRHPQDVERLRAALAALGREDLGIILKIETVQGFERLPQLLLTALRTRRVGVMIARGDLAVECGYQRLAELQEEILWLCEAAHVPVIWATQVLDQLARTGQPTRAEITDAAMAERAECVMLNKGPYITDAVTLLSDVLGRMGDHQHKKIALLRQLHSWPTEP